MSPAKKPTKAQVREQEQIRRGHLMSARQQFRANQITEAARADARKAAKK